MWGGASVVGGPRRRRGTLGGEVVSARAVVCGGDARGERHRSFSTPGLAGSSLGASGSREGGVRPNIPGSGRREGCARLAGWWV